MKKVLFYIILMVIGLFPQISLANSFFRDSNGFSLGISPGSVVWLTGFPGDLGTSANVSSDEVYGGWVSSSNELTRTITFKALDDGIVEFDYKWSFVYDVMLPFPDMGSIAEGVLESYITLSSSAQSTNQAYSERPFIDWGRGFTVEDGGFYTGHVSLPFVAGEQGQLTLHSLTTASVFTPDPEPATSVPEPATILLLGSGLFGLVELRRKFKK